MSESITAAPDAAPAPAPDSDASFEAQLGAIETEAEAPAPADPAPAADLQPSMVPLAALKEAREEAREAKRESRLVAERLGKMQEALTARLAPPQPQAPAIPDYEADPAANLDHRTRNIEQYAMQQMQERQQQQHTNQVIGILEQAEAQFRTETPDYSEAAKHAQAVITRMAPFWGTDPRSALLGFTENAIRAGRNPAQATYEFAKANGYTGAAPGGMEQLQRGAAASRSVGSSGQPSAVVPNLAQRVANMTPKEMGAMSDADFEKALASIR